MHLLVIHFRSHSEVLLAHCSVAPRLDLKLSAWVCPLERCSRHWGSASGTVVSVSTPWRPRLWPDSEIRRQKVWMSL